MRVKSVTYYRVCPNFMAVRAEIGDGTTSALGKWENEIHHYKTLSTNCEELFNMLALLVMA